MPKSFDAIVDSISDIGFDWHKDNLISNSKNNLKYIKNTVLDLPKNNTSSALIISAGPSLEKLKIIDELKTLDYSGQIIAIDATYIRLLKNNLIPDYILTLDPHPTRMIRWFGDYEFELNTKSDDYFERQDLDVHFRDNSIEQNSLNIKIVNKLSNRMKLIICCTAPNNVVERCIDAGFDLYWWAPIMDNPNNAYSLTREIHDITNLPCFNTGGNVGTAAWVFARTILNVENIGIVGMDLGYFKDTPITETQTYYELQNITDTEDQLNELFLDVKNPHNNITYYTDPTYYWYKLNILQLLKSSNSKLFNCSGSGTLFGDGVEFLPLSSFVEKFNN